jgi:hypothetical protein
VDAETGELHPRLSTGQREYDLDLARVNLPGLKAGASVFGASGDVGECPASALTGGGVV